MVNIYWTQEARSYTYQHDFNSAAAPTSSAILLGSSSTRERFVSSVFAHNNTTDVMVVAIGIARTSTLSYVNTAIINTARIPAQGTAILSDLKSPIYLNTSSSNAQSLVYTLLDKAGSNIGILGALTFTVTYHEFADNTGGYELNLEISRKRAQALADQLRAELGRDVDIKVMAVGEDAPVACNDETGYDRNRRVEVWASR